jgi:hypothetical protein
MSLTFTCRVSFKENLYFHCIINFSLFRERRTQSIYQSSVTPDKLKSEAAVLLSEMPHALDGKLYYHYDVLSIYLKICLMM